MIYRDIKFYTLNKVSNDINTTNIYKLIKILKLTSEISELRDSGLLLSEKFCRASRRSSRELSLFGSAPRKFNYLITTFKNKSFKLYNKKVIGPAIFEKLVVRNSTWL